MRLAKLAGRDYSLLRRLAPTDPEVGPFGKTITVLDHQIPYKALVQSGRRFCPACVALDGVADRIEWSLRFVRACTIHRIQLVEQCAACGKRIRWGKAALDHCQCGTTFKYLPDFSVFNRVDEEAIVGSRYLVGLLYDLDQNTLPLLQGLSFIQIFVSARTLGLFGASSQDTCTLDDSMQSSLGRWLTRGFRLLALNPELFRDRILKLTPKRYGRPSKKHFGAILDLHEQMVGSGAAESALTVTLAQISDILRGGEV